MKVTNHSEKYIHLKRQLAWHTQSWMENTRTQMSWV